MSDPLRRPRLLDVLLLGACLAGVARAGGPGPTRVSVSSGGGQGNGSSGPGQETRVMAASDDGRFVAFLSQADDLVAGDTNLRRDVFRRDRLTDVTVRVSVGDVGQQGDGSCNGVAMSADGRFVAFSSESTNLVPGDANAATDVFVWDAQTGTSTCVSLGMGGVPGNGASSEPTISGDGAWIGFTSKAPDLVGGDANGFSDVFLHERTTGVTTLVSATPGGAAGNGESRMPSLSRDGATMAFSTGSTDLGPADPHNLADIYVRDLVTGAMERVTIQGVTFNGASVQPAVSGDGRWVAFTSAAMNIVAGTVSIGNVFLYDRQTGLFELVSINPGGTSGDAPSSAPSFSADGAWIAFQSGATDLVPADTNAAYDVFVRRRDQGWTERVSLSHTGAQLPIASGAPALTADGRYCAYYTPDGSVVPGDTNGTYDVFLHDRGYGSDGAGGVYCTSNPNSTGLVATIEITGSQVAADQSLLLSSSALPSSTLGYYLLSETQDHVPGFGGSQGVLCLGGALYRLSAYVLDSGANGEVSLQVPFGGLPVGVTLDAGESWSFQLWFRDKLGPVKTSNTSDAACVFLH